MAIQVKCDFCGRADSADVDVLTASVKYDFPINVDKMTNSLEARHDLGWWQVDLCKGCRAELQRYVTKVWNAANEA